MAAFRALANGDISQFVASVDQEKQIPYNAQQFPYQVQFDEQTNAGLITAFNANSAQFRMDGGTLTQNGTPATVNPPTAFYRAFQQAAAIVGKANSSIPHAYTTEEIDAIVGAAFRGAGLA